MQITCTYTDCKHEWNYKGAPDKRSVTCPKCYRRVSRSGDRIDLESVMAGILARMPDESVESYVTASAVVAMVQKIEKTSLDLLGRIPNMKRELADPSISWQQPIETLHGINEALREAAREIEAGVNKLQELSCGKEKATT